MDIKEKLIAAKMELQQKYKFLLYAIYENDFQIKNKKWIINKTKGFSDIAFVSFEYGKFTVYFSDKFIETEKTTSIAGVILHEILHVVLEHIDRMNISGIDKNLYNIAADFYINGKIKKENKVDLPKKALYDKFFDKFSSTDEIYDYLKNNCKNIKYKVLEGFDSANSYQASKNTKDIITKIKSQIQAGLSLQKNIGSNNSCSEILGIFKQAVEPVVDWKQIVAQSANIVKGHDDYSFFVKNPLSTYDFILPGTYDNTLNVCFIVDVSGSIMERGLANILTEIIAATTFTKVSGKIITCDTKAELACEFTHDDNLYDKFKKIKISGGGGTDMNIGLKYAKKLNKDFDLYILVTDGYIDKTYANILDKKLLVLSTDVDCKSLIVGDFDFAKINHV